jgi:hypothetical protein
MNAPAIHVASPNTTTVTTAATSHRPLRPTSTTPRHGTLRHHHDGTTTQENRSHCPGTAQASRPGDFAAGRSPRRMFTTVLDSTVVNIARRSG